MSDSDQIVSESEQFIIVPPEVIKEKVLINLDNYKKTLLYMYADAPLEILCLPKVIERILLSNGCIRVYDLLDRDFTKIKGLGVTRIRKLTASLDQFVSMC